MNNTKKKNGQNGQKRKKNGNGNGNGGFSRQVISRNRPAPLSFNAENRRPINNAVTRLSGSDLIAKLTVHADISTVGDSILLKLPVSPSAYPGTRITQLSQLYERYRLRKFNIRYVPAVPVTLACQLLIYVDLDPNDDPTAITSVEQLLRQAVAQTGSQQWNFHCAKTVPMAQRADDQLYYTGEDKLNPRFSQQGTAYIVQLTTPVGIDGTPSTEDFQAGSIFIDWTVDFQTPQINPESLILAPRAFNSQVRLADIKGLEYTGEETTWSGLNPGQYYTVTIAWEGPADANASIVVSSTPSGGSTLRGADGLFFSSKQTNSVLNCNDTGSTSQIYSPGFLIVLADHLGVVTFNLFKDSTLETQCWIVIYPLTSAGTVVEDPAFEKRALKAMQKYPNLNFVHAPIQNHKFSLLSRSG
jgi:hypothetical protein